MAKSKDWDKEIEKVLSALESRLPLAGIAWGSYADSTLNDRIRLSLIVCRKR
jgi:hypothetical protein